MNTCIGKIIEKSFIDVGYTIAAQDSINDIAQHCDHSGLRE